MLRERIIRAWKDPEFRTSLSEEDLAELPENPAGAIELTDDELEMAAGGSFRASANPTGQSSSSASSQRSASSSQSQSRSASNRSSHSSSNRASNSGSASASSGQATSMQPYTSRYPSSNRSSGNARWSSN